MTNKTLAIFLVGFALVTGCAKKTETTTTDSTNNAVSTAPPAPTDTAHIGAMDSGLNAPAKSEGMTGILADSNHKVDSGALAKNHKAASTKKKK